MANKPDLSNGFKIIQFLFFFTLTIILVCQFKGFKEVEKRTEPDTTFVFPPPIDLSLKKELPVRSKNKKPVKKVQASSAHIPPTLPPGKIVVWNPK